MKYIYNNKLQKQYKFHDSFQHCKYFSDFIFLKIKNIISLVTMAGTKRCRKRNSDNSGNNNNNKISKQSKKNISVQSQAQHVIKPLQKIMIRKKKIITIQKENIIRDY